MPDRFWVNGPGTWGGGSTANWSSTSGGASGASEPTLSDRVIFDANSDSGAPFTVTVSGTGGRCGGLDASGLDQNMTVAGAPSYFEIKGAFNLAGGRVTWSSGAVLYLDGTGTHSITTGGTAFASAVIVFQGAGSTYTLQDALTQTGSGYLLFERGTFNANDFNVTTGGARANVGASARAVNMGAGTWTITGSGTLAWAFTANANLTVLGASSTLLFTSASAKTADLGSYTFGVVAQGGAGALTVTYTGAAAADIQNPYSATGAATIRFAAGQTLTVGDFTADGAAGKILALESTSPGSPALLSKASGAVSASHLSIKDITALGGATWEAEYSTDLGGNAGWAIYPWSIGGGLPTGGNFLQLF